jgi:hypothetical protein
VSKLAHQPTNRNCTIGIASLDCVPVARGQAEVVTALLQDEETMSDRLKIGKQVARQLGSVHGAGALEFDERDLLDRP